MYLIFLTIALRISYVRRNCRKIHMNTDINKSIFITDHYGIKHLRFQSLLAQVFICTMGLSFWQHQNIPKMQDRFNSHSDIIFTYNEVPGIIYDSYFQCFNLLAFGEASKKQELKHFVIQRSISVHNFRYYKFYDNFIIYDLKIFNHRQN